MRVKLVKNGKTPEEPVETPEIKVDPTAHFGIHSDTITSLLNNSISDANGRDRLWAAVSEQIKNTFPLGKGAFGDRLAAGKIFSWGYSHNIFFEMIASFGVIGVIALLVLLVQSGRILITNEYEEWSPIFTIFFCWVLVHVH